MVLGKTISWGLDLISVLATKLFGVIFLTGGVYGESIILTMLGFAILDLSPPVWKTAKKIYSKKKNKKLKLLKTEFKKGECCYDVDVDNLPLGQPTRELEQEILIDENKFEVKQEFK